MRKIRTISFDGFKIIVYPRYWNSNEPGRYQIDYGSHKSRVVVDLEKLFNFLNQTQKLSVCFRLDELLEKERKIT